jgi:hypothetical protein
MPPWQGGGEMILQVTFEKTEYQDPHSSVARSIFWLRSLNAPARRSPKKS